MMLLYRDFKNAIRYTLQNFGWKKRVKENVVNKSLEELRNGLSALKKDVEDEFGFFVLRAKKDNIKIKKDIIKLITELKKLNNKIIIINERLINH